MTTLYTVQRCKKDNTLYGPTHASDNGNISLCGLHFDNNWYITNNTFDGEVTCEKCQRIIKETTLIDRAKGKMMEI